MCWPHKSQENWVITQRHKNVNKNTWTTGQVCKIHSQPQLLEINNSSKTNIWRMTEATRALWFLASPQQLLYYMRCEVHGQQGWCFCYMVSVPYNKWLIFFNFSRNSGMLLIFLVGQFWLWWPRNYQGGVCSTESQWLVHVSVSKTTLKHWAWMFIFEFGNDGLKKKKKLNSSSAYYFFQSFQPQKSSRPFPSLNWDGGYNLPPILITCFHVLCHMMTPEQTPSADDDHDMRLKASGKSW